MADEKLIFSSSIDALLKVSSGRIKPQTQAQLTALRFGPPHKLEPAYPADDWAKAVKLIGADLFPGMPGDAQHQQLGKATVMQFAETFLGQAMFGAARVIGVRRSLERMTRSLRTGANFIETRFTWLDDQHQELWINDVSDVPGFYAGLIVAGSEVMRGWADRIEIKQREGASCLYEMTLTS